MNAYATPRSLKINGFTINDGSDCYVIAEVGNNHQGDMAKAIDLFHGAKMAGCHAVKLQKRDNRSLYTRKVFDMPYENPNSFGATYGEHREFLEFGKKDYRELQQLAKELDLDFFATAFDYPSTEFLAEFDMPVYKIASGDLKNIPLIKRVAKLGKPLIVSVGGGTIEDAQRVYDEIMPINSQLCFLQCTATYPTEAADMHLRVITTLRDRFPELVIGLSDHYNGIAMAVAAYVLGARVIEKHFTLNHTWKGTDHALSLEPIGMHKMVRDLQRTRIALGDPVKRLLPAEEPALKKMGKSLFAARDLPAGHVLTEEDVALKCPGGGIPPADIEQVLGRRTTRDLAGDEMLEISSLQ
jgi:sialic acid synthase